MSKDAQVLSTLESGVSITPLYAAQRWGILALHSAISRIRKQGYVIRCERRQEGTTHYGEYFLVRGKA